MSTPTDQAGRPDEHDELLEKFLAESTGNDGALNEKMEVRLVV